MNLNVILEVAITLAFLFSLLSVMVSSVNELIMYFLKKRGKFLYWALEEVFKDKLKNKNYASLLLRNPLIDRLRKDQKSLPSYIGGVQFSEALIAVMCEEYDTKKYKYSDTPNVDGSYDLIPAAPIVQDAFSKFKVSVQLMHNSDVKRLFTSFLNGTDNYDKLKINMQNWYNDYMERVNGWYKNHLQIYLFCISLTVAIAFNVDTIHVVKTISKDKLLREQLVKAAETYVETEIKNQGSKTSSDTTYAQIVETIKKMNDSIVGYGFPIGWDLSYSEKTKCCHSPACICSADKCIDTCACDASQCSKPKMALLHKHCCKSTHDGSHMRSGRSHSLCVENTQRCASDSCCVKQNSLSCNKPCYEKVPAATMTTCRCKKQSADKPSRAIQSGLLTILGWLLTAMALSFGAPFWFDLLSKLVNLRKSGIKPTKTPTV